MPHPLLALALRDLLDRAAAHHRLRHLLQDIRVLGVARRLVARLDQQPACLLFVRPSAHADQMPGPVELLALELEGETALLEPLVRIAFRIPATAVPDHHRAAAILALRDGAFERVVLDRMVLDLHGQPLLAGHQARTLGDRPALHHAVELEPEIVVQPPRGVLLDDVLVALAARLAPARLRRHVELAFAAVDLQSHGWRPLSTAFNKLDSSLCLCTRRELPPSPGGLRHSHIFGVKSRRGGVSFSAPKFQLRFSPHPTAVHFGGRLPLQGGCAELRLHTPSHRNAPTRISRSDSPRLSSRA